MKLALTFVCICLAASSQAPEPRVRFIDHGVGAPVAESRGSSRPWTVTTGRC